jgi:hypothetical protein
MGYNMWTLEIFIFASKCNLTNLQYIYFQILHPFSSYILSSKINRTTAMSDPSTALPLPTKGTINSETYGEICIGIGGDDSDTEGVPAASSEQTVGCFTFDDEGYIVPLPFGTS